MIPLQTKGKPKNIFNYLIGNINIVPSDKDSYVLNYSSDQKIIISKRSYSSYHANGVFNAEINHLTPGDVVIVYPDGYINTLFRIDSEDNTIFMTNNCNQNCIMCSQPPKKKDDIEHFYNINNILIDFIPQSTRQIGISGGEPTLCGKYLNLLLTKLFYRIPSINVYILTNAVLFSDINLIHNLDGLEKEKILFSVPLYGDNHYTHDSIVQSKGSFYRTIKGIHNLFNYGFRVELRVIPQVKNIMRLDKMAHFIYKNLTFVEQVAFMSIENIGNARKNIRDIWVPFKDLIGPLEKATNFLRISGISCSLYNYQSCVINNRLQEISKSTISDWKLEYLPVCSTCSLKNSCGGIFNSSLEIMKEYVKPI